MIAKISILISIVVSTINVILLMRLYQEEYDDDEEMYRWGVAICSIPAVNEVFRRIELWST